VGWGIGSSRVTTPAARLTAGRPIERALSPIKFEITIVLHHWVRQRPASAAGQMASSVKTEEEPLSQGDIV
jgi:hypothetical protein